MTPDWQLERPGACAWSVGPLVCVVFGQQPEEETIRLYCEARVRLGPRFTSSLIVPFVSPGARQRRIFGEYKEQLARHALARSALLTDSRLVHGALIAASWLVNVTYQPFGLRQGPEALAWLNEVSRFDLAAATGLLQRALRAYGPPT